MKINRRSFLASGLAVAAGTVAGPAKARAQSDGAEEVVLATLLDLSKCIACGACVQACREANARKYPEPVKPFPKMYPSRVKAADWSDKRHVDDRLTPYNWLYIQTASGTYDGKPFELNIPRRCLHCQNPPCANLCPWGAASKDGRGIVAIDDEICLGGSKCKDVCPWHIPERQTGVGLYLKLAPSFAGNGVMFKCDRCQDRVVAGGTPACIEACPEGVQTIGPRDEILAQARKLAEESGGFLYGDTENGGTNTFYVSPVPFDVLNQSIEKGPGRPHLAAVADPFTAEDVLARAVYAAPLAGLMAGALHLIRGATSEGKMNKRVLDIVFRLTVFALLFTGFAQMPIFARYYLADVPGFAWTADYYLNHVLHYGLAAVLLVFLGWRLPLAMRRTWNAGGILLALTWAGVVSTGLVRVMKNQPDAFFSPTFVVLVDWGHLGFVMLLGLVSLGRALAIRMKRLS